MTMKAVGTAAMEMVQEVEIQFDEVRETNRLVRDCGSVSFLYANFSSTSFLYVVYLLFILPEGDKAGGHDRC